MKEQIIELMGLTDYEEYDKYLIVTGVNAGGKPTCQIYNTNVKKLHKCKVAGFYFFTEEQRTNWINLFKGRVQRRLNDAAERKAAKAAFVNPAKVGDILSSSWGYEQTNIDFYQVIEVKHKSIVIREIAQQKEQGQYDMTGTCTPIKDHFKSEPMLKKVSAHYSGEGYVVSVNSFAIATPWDGKPEHWTAYA